MNFSNTLKFIKKTVCNHASHCYLMPKLSAALLHTYIMNALKNNVLYDLIIF